LPQPGVPLLRGAVCFGDWDDFPYRLPEPAVGAMSFAVHRIPANHPEWIDLQ